MRVERFIVGWISSSAAIWRAGEDSETQIRFPVPAYLVESDSERILIDCGLHPEAVTNPARRYGQADSLAAFSLELEEPIDEQVDLSTLTKVVLTHLHFDHAGGLALLPRSVPVIVQRSEWEAGASTAAIRRNFLLPTDYADIDAQVVLVDGDHDLLGDGSIELMLTPGHTPGHQSVRVGEDLIIGADVTHFSSGLDDHRFPAFADDFDAQKSSAERLRTFRDAGVLVLPGHDPSMIVPGTIVW